ncbi:MAG: reverse transcriptase N-terminal domain-containing protein [Xenococcus sp. (in: cyanobacteria)]
MSKTDSQLNTVEWGKLDWRKAEKAVWKLQKRIYRAYVNGDVKRGRRLQKTLIKSYYNRIISVRKVSQDNQGKKTAGVDRIKSLTPKQRLTMAKNLKPENKAKPIRRVWIPKPGKKEQRPLGIPVMRDRAIQCLVKNALEPEWEARFEPNSYGFRPGRGAHDAIGAIFNAINSNSKLGELIFNRLKRWAYRRHPNKNTYWIIDKYWTTIGNDNWVFGEKDGTILLKHAKTVIKRHNKIKGEKTPYDGDTIYWAKRRGVHPELPDSIAYMLKQQKGKCQWCGLNFQNGDLIEKDHKIPKALGGKNKNNLQLLHRHCHDIKTKYDLKAIKKHKSHKEYLKLMEQFNQKNWKWIDDIPTLV